MLSTKPFNGAIKKRLQGIVHVQNDSYYTLVITLQRNINHIFCQRHYCIRASETAKPRVVTEA